jgi:hypothetical protein
VLAHLHRPRGSFEAELAEQIGSKAANVIVEAMIAAVMGEKHKLEQQNGGTA